MKLKHKKLRTGGYSARKSRDTSIKVRSPRQIQKAMEEAHATQPNPNKEQAMETGNPTQGETSAITWLGTNLSEGDPQFSVKKTNPFPIGDDVTLQAFIEQLPTGKYGVVVATFDGNGTRVSWVAGKLLPGVASNAYKRLQTAMSKAEKALQEKVESETKKAAQGEQQAAPEKPTEGDVAQVEPTVTVSLEIAETLLGYAQYVALNQGQAPSALVAYNALYKAIRETWASSQVADAMEWKG